MISNTSSFTYRLAAGWSSPVARQAHNLKVAGSNPAPAPNDNDTPVAKALGVLSFGGLLIEPVKITPNMQGGVHLAALGRWALT